MALAKPSAANPSKLKLLNAARVLLKALLSTLSTAKDLRLSTS
ncbi:hypothetical protein [Gloeobacter violaceus]|nr:hypothetical protein [Gloeobacter violaceus]